MNFLTYASILTEATSRKIGANPAIRGVAESDYIAGVAASLH
jgi:hypothetical protein